MSDSRLVLLPTDGSPTALAAGRFAVDIARAEHDTVLVLGVAERAMFGQMEDEGITAAIHSFMTDVVAGEAARIRAAGIDASELVTDARSIHEEILRVAAERGVDVIVMGTHGQTGLARAVIGSVADRVVRHSTVPVVLVPQKAEA